MAEREIKSFIEQWRGLGYPTTSGSEKSDTQKFWLDFLRCVCDVENPVRVIEFEKRVQLEHVSFIDAYIESTHVLIEQKSSDVDINKPIPQSDGTLLTPFEQAKRYDNWLSYSLRVRWIIICNFRELHIHDMEHPKAPPEIIKLEDLASEWRKLQFIANPKGTTPKDIHEVNVSVQAGVLVGKLYEALKSRYKNPDSEHSLRSLNILCVRIVFLLYAEDSGLFEKCAFHDYLLKYQMMAREALKSLFAVLSKKIDDRDYYINTDLATFPYVNGGLFEETDIEIPHLSGIPLEIILHEMSEGFDWSRISPTIFGAVFESTLNPDTRHSGGMHYTSIENIHKVIDPLFLDDLTAEAASLISQKPSATRTRKLREFQKRMASMTFLDPACGSGNFLTETYLSLRRLENRIIAELLKGQRQITFAFSKSETPIQISISQFYGIEINNFAVSVARTALWIAETQMMNETKNIVQVYEEVLPLKSYNHIIENNALLIDWTEVVERKNVWFIMGNPPFMGYSNQTKEQKQVLSSLFADCKDAGKIDYVAGWYYKAAEFMKGTRIKAAFVSTNSITQGEQVSAIFRPITERFGIHIDFAHQTFKWDSESRDKAQVHVVVMGFSEYDAGTSRRLYTADGVRDVTHINFYLVPGNDVWIEARQKAIDDDALPMRRGSQPTDDGNLILTLEEKNELIKANPLAAKFIRPFMMGVDFIQRKPRYCLWMVGVNPDDIAKCPKVMERIKRVKEFRLASKKPATQRKADTPTLFDERVEMTTNYIAIPVVSSGERKYIPINYLDANIIPGNKLFVIPDATLYHFGVLTSRVHMAWTRRVTGRLGMSYSYSNTIVYNNFVWPSSTDKLRMKIELTAKKILNARALYPDSSFASLYNDDLMPLELRKAHRENDAAVCEAYGWEKNISEEEIVARLFVLYKKLTHLK